MSEIATVVVQVPGIPGPPGPAGPTGEVPGSRAINANAGLTGGGNLTADRTLALTGQALAVHNVTGSGMISRTAAGTIATTPTEAVPMGGQRLTGLGNATADADALNRVTGDARYLADMLEATMKGRAAGTGTGAPVDLTAAQVKAILGSDITLGTITAASGTAVDFTGLPADIKRLKVSFSAVSTNGSAGLLVQIGTSGGIQTTGYAGGVSSSFSTSATGDTSTAGILATDAVSAGTTYYGSVTFEIINAANGTFVATVTGGRSDLGVGYTGGGAKALGGALDRVRITTTNGTDTFDAGNINISYEV